MAQSHKIAVNGPVGLRLLFLPNKSLLGVMRSAISTSDVMLLTAIGMLLMELLISEAIVSHWMCDRRWRCTFLSSEFRTDLIFRSKRPCTLCPPTGHVWNSKPTSLCSCCLILLGRISSSDILLLIVHLRRLATWIDNRIGTKSAWRLG